MSYLATTMSFGVIILLSIAFVYSYFSYMDYFKDRRVTLNSIAENIIPDVTRDLSIGNIEAMKVRMEFIVLKEQERNIQIRIADQKGNTVYQSDEFDWKCNSEFSRFISKIPQCAERKLESSDGAWGSMYLTRDVHTFFSFFKESYVPLLFLILACFLSVLIFMIRYLLRTEVITPLNHVVQALKQDRPIHEDRSYEWVVLSEAIAEYKDKIINYVQRQNQMSKDLEKEKLMSEVTAQLAHDIRSPLAALDSMAATMPELDEKKRLLIRNATARIHNIANNLLDRTFTKNNNLSLHMFSSIIRNMVFEKKEQYKANTRVSIHDHVDQKTYGAFAKIEINDFKRIISNLIDNAVQAIPGTGFVRVALSQTQDNVVIEVFDNGKGIPEYLIPRIMEKGITTRKEGSGLGLYFVDQKIKEWGGHVEIDSKINQGTTIRLILKKEPAPAWFVSEIVIDDEGEYVVLDDDMTIHQMWDSRILQVVRKSIKIHHFEDEKSFEDWFTDKKMPENTTYFFDYELIGNRNSGLDIIERLNIKNKAILVTSNYEDEAIQKRCERLGVRMIPKELAGFVPIINTA